MQGASSELDIREGTETEEAVHHAVEICTFAAHSTRRIHLLAIQWEAFSGLHLQAGLGSIGAEVEHLQEAEMAMPLMRYRGCRLLRRIHIILNSRVKALSILIVNVF